MPKVSFSPTLYDSVKKITIADLKKKGALESDTKSGFSLAWQRNGIDTGRVWIGVNLLDENSYMELKYSYRDQERHYRIQLVTVPSNLGTGYLWYFLCPVTHKRCRVLYCIGGYFLHREAFKGCFYESQTRSKQGRLLDSYYKNEYDLERLYDELNSTRFRKTYKGIPTKRYIRLMAKIRKAEHELQLQQMAMMKMMGI